MPGRDIYWNQTSLLVNGNTATGSGGWDAGPNRLSVTENNYPRRDAASPFQSAPGYWSNSFDGSGDYLSSSISGGACDFGTGDFTVEGWFRFSSVATHDMLILYVGGVAKYYFYCYMGTQLAFYDATSGHNPIINQTLNADIWYHIAFVRYSGTLNIYVNGVSGSSTTYTVSMLTGINSLQIGSQSPVRESTACYVSNLRIVKGTAVYTANFTPPTTALTAVSGTSLLTCQDNRFKDNSTNNFTLTPTGNVAVEPESPFRGGSVYSIKGYASLPSSGIILGTSDFTIECFAYPTAWDNNYTFVGNGTGGGEFLFGMSQAPYGKPYFYKEGWVWTSPTALTLNQWNHVALCRQGSNWAIFLNGVSVVTATGSTNISATTALFFGYFIGYQSNLRIVKGSTVYDPTAATITVPGNELTPIANTVLLTCQSPTQLVDYSANNFPLTTTGTISVSNAGPGLLSRKNSVYFDGNGDALTAAANAGSDIGTGDFTIEMWVYPTTGYSTPPVLLSWDGNLTKYVSIGSSGYASFYGVISAGIVPLNSWTHLAFVRSGTTVKSYTNGTLTQTATDNSAITTSGIVNIARFSTGSSFFGGYVSNLRIIKGTALYDLSFTPSNQPLEAITNTVLLTCQSETFDDLSANNLAITPIGKPFTSQFNPYDITRSTYGSVLTGSDAFTPGLDSPATINIGTGDFTFEFWCNYFQSSSYPYMGKLPSLRNLSGEFPLEIRMANFASVWATATGSDRISSNAWVMQPGSWCHVAVVRASGILKLFINGVQNGSDTPSTANLGSVGIRIGSDTARTLCSNVRLTAGVARYTTAFTPSLTHFQPDSQTTVLLAGTSEITPRNKVFTDYSNNALSITAYNNATQSSNSPYTTRNGQDYSPSVNGGSAYFDGGFDYISTSNASAFAFGTGDYTVEGWYNISSTNPLYPRFFTMTNLDISIEGPTSTAATIYVRTGGSTLTYGVSNSFGRWYHLAVVRKSGVLRVYQNGVQIGSDVTNTTNITSTSAAIGGTGSGTGNEYFYGYISDLRVVKGAAVYQANFPVPTQPVGLYSLNNATTTLYLPFTSSSIIDETGKNSIEPVGDVKSSTLIKKYNNTSMYFDGNGDYLVLPSQGSITGDFTVEFWANKPGVSSTGYDGVCGEIANAANIKWSVGLTTTTGTTQGFSVYVRDASGGGYGLCANNTITGIDDGLWHHWAACRSGSTWYLFKDGVQLTKTTDTASTKPLLSSDAFYIGNNKDAGSNYYFNGYIDDLRITKGIARYTANFTPPTAALPTAEVYTQPVITNYQDNGTDLGTKYVTKSYLMDWYPDLIPAFNNGVLYSWGRNDYGQLGDGTTTSRSSPKLVVGGSSWKQVSFGSQSTTQYSAGIKSDGTLWAWGYNYYGQLGDGTTSTRSSPVTVAGGGNNWKQISVGYSTTAAIKTDGTLWMWGWNNAGQLGDYSTSSRISPVTVAGGGTNWKQVVTGYNSSYAIKSDGTLWSWGNNTYGQLGVSGVGRSSPGTTAGGGNNWKQVSYGAYAVGAIKTDGTLWTWGVGGALGDGTTTQRSSPVTTAGGGTDWKQVSFGDSHGCSIKQDGTLWTWGYNNVGQLGDGTTISRLSPVTVAGGGTNWKYVVGGYRDTAAIKTDGTLWMWGRNDYGQLGDGTTTSRSSPVTVAGGGTNWKQVSCGYSTVAIVDSNL